MCLDLLCWRTSSFQSKNLIYEFSFQKFPFWVAGDVESLMAHNLHQQLRCMSVKVPHITGNSNVCSRACWVILQAKHQSFLWICDWNPPMTVGFPSQRASNVETVSMPWCHHAKGTLVDSDVEGLMAQSLCKQSWNNFHLWFPGRANIRQVLQSYIYVRKLWPKLWYYFVCSKLASPAWILKNSSVSTSVMKSQNILWSYFICL